MEHLDPSEYQVSEGANVLWKLLDARFPQKEQVDELGEVLAEVFSLKVNKGETMDKALSTASSTVDGPLEVPKCRDALSRRRLILITDCKSLYSMIICIHHLHKHRLKIVGQVYDAVIIRESCKTMQAFVRWVPTNRMLADAYTKDQGDPMDLLRSCLKRGQYQISEEDMVLQFQADEKQEHLERRKGKVEWCSTVSGPSIRCG